MRQLLLFAFSCAVVIGLVAGHGYLREPIARTSIQLREREFGTSQPYWWDHQGVWCANVRQNLQYSTCGRCGEAAGNRDASQGGRYDKGVIVATYTAGSRIQVESEFGATHGGQFHLELCAQQTETDNCFVPLSIVSGNVRVLNNTACVDNSQSRINVQVQLPTNVRCNRCTMRWTYRTYYFSDPWDPAWQATNCWVNPDPTQTFRNCADIRIV